MIHLQKDSQKEKSSSEKYIQDKEVKSTLDTNKTLFVCNLTGSVSLTLNVRLLIKRLFVKIKRFKYRPMGLTLHFAASRKNIWRSLFRSVADRRFWGVG